MASADDLRTDVQRARAYQLSDLQELAALTEYATEVMLPNAANRARRERLAFEIARREELIASYEAALDGVSDLNVDTAADHTSSATIHIDHEPSTPLAQTPVLEDEQALGTPLEMGTAGHTEQMPEVEMPSAAPVEETPAVEAPKRSRYATDPVEQTPDKPVDKKSSADKKTPQGNNPLGIDLDGNAMVDGFFAEIGKLTSNPKNKLMLEIVKDRVKETVNDPKKRQELLNKLDPNRTEDDDQ